MEEFNLLYGSLEERLREIERESAKVGEYLGNLRVSEINSVNTAIDFQRKLEKMTSNYRREQDRSAKLKEQLILAQAREKQLQLENARLLIRIRELEKRPPVSIELHSESDPAGSYLPAGSTASHILHQEYQDDDVRPVTQSELENAQFPSAFNDIPVEAPADERLDQASAVAVITRGIKNDMAPNNQSLANMHVAPPAPVQESSSIPQPKQSPPPSMQDAPLAASVNASLPPAVAKTPTKRKVDAQLAEDTQKLMARAEKKTKSSASTPSRLTNNSRCSLQPLSVVSSPPPPPSSSSSPQVTKKPKKEQEEAKKEKMVVGTISSSIPSPLPKQKKMVVVTSASTSSSSSSSPPPSSSQVIVKEEKMVSMSPVMKEEKMLTNIKTSVCQKKSVHSHTTALGANEDLSSSDVPAVLDISESDCRDSLSDPLGKLKSVFDKTWSAEYRGREDKLSILVSDIEKAIANRKESIGSGGNVFYISGMPGSGKTGSLSRLPDLLGSDRAKVIALNCTRLPTFSNVISEVISRFGKNKISSSASVADAKAFAITLDQMKAQPATILILDEISDRCKRTHQMVKEMFQWVTTVKVHPLIVIGVANVLVDVSDPAFRDFVKFKHIPFEPYTKSELEQILSERLRIFSKKFPKLNANFRQSNKNSFDHLISADAISLVAERAANRNGDARYAVDMCTAAIKNVKARCDRKIGCPMICADDLQSAIDPLCEVSSAHLVILSFLCVDGFPELATRELEGSKLQFLYETSARHQNTPIVQPLTPSEFSAALSLLTSQGYLKQNLLRKKSKSSAQDASSFDYCYSLSNVTADDVVLKGSAENQSAKLIRKFFEQNFPKYLQIQTK